MTRLELYGFPTLRFEDDGAGMTEQAAGKTR